MHKILRRLLEMSQRLPIPYLLKLIEYLTSRSNTSFSSYGEDAILSGILSRYFLEFKKELKLSYIDIGAWRPMSGSNTYWLYQRGLSGTVIEPNPHFNLLWKAVRPRDNYLGVGCSSSESEELHIFHDNAASNTFDQNFATDISQKQSFILMKKITVPCLTLKSIVDKHLSIYDEPFLLDVDVEGRDFDVITTYEFPIGRRPILILIEDTCNDSNSIKDSKINMYLTSHSYQLVARSAITSIYVDLKQELSSILTSVV